MSEQVVIPSNPKDREDIMKEIEACCDALTRIGGERDFIKETIKALSEKYEIPKKYLNKLLRTHYKQNAKDVVNENEEFVQLYEGLTGEDLT